MTNKKVFIDCGANRGQGLRQFMQMYNIDSSWEVESYEPNPDCNLAEHIQEFPFVKAFTKAVWSHTGKVTFSKTLVTETNNDEGSSVNGLNVISTTQYPQEIIEAECVDISEILNRYDDDDFIVVKLDIEGGEYEVARKMIKDESIKKINDLYIEWHVKYGVYGETYESEEELKNQLRQYEVNLHDWY